MDDFPEFVSYSNYSLPLSPNPQDCSREMTWMQPYTHSAVSPENNIQGPNPRIFSTNEDVYSFDFHSVPSYHHPSFLLMPPTPDPQGQYNHPGFTPELWTPSHQGQWDGFVYGRGGNDVCTPVVVGASPLFGSEENQNVKTPSSCGGHAIDSPYTSAIHLPYASASNSAYTSPFPTLSTTAQPSASGALRTPKRATRKSTPKSSEKRAKKPAVWVRRQCSVYGCAEEVVFEIAEDLECHLQDAHPHLSQNQVKDLVMRTPDPYSSVL